MLMICRSGWNRVLLPMVLGLAPLAAPAALADDPSTGSDMLLLLPPSAVAADGQAETVTPTLRLLRDGATNESLALRGGELLINYVGPEDSLLGLTTAPVDEVLRSQLKLPEGQGLLAASVASGGPADRVGLKPNDILLTLGGQPIARSRDLVENLKRAGDHAVELKLIRDGMPTTLRVRSRARVTFAPAAPEAPEFFIGVSVNPVGASLRAHLPGLPDGQGLIVTEVIAESPAERAGVVAGDILLSFNRTWLDSPETLAACVQDRGDQPTSLTFLRGREPTTVQVTPKARERSEQGGTYEYEVEFTTGAIPGESLNLISVAPASSVRVLNRLTGQVHDEDLARLQSPGRVASPDQVEARLKELTEKVDALNRQIEELGTIVRKQAGKK